MIDREKIKQRLKDESTQLRREVQHAVIAHVVTAFGLVAALAWNDAIQGLIKHFFIFDASTIWAKVAYAGGITLVVVVVTVYLTRWFVKK